MCRASSVYRVVHSFTVLWTQIVTIKDPCLGTHSGSSQQGWCVCSVQGQTNSLGIVVVVLDHDQDSCTMLCWPSSSCTVHSSPCARFATRATMQLTDTPACFAFARPCLQLHSCVPHHWPEWLRQDGGSDWYCAHPATGERRHVPFMVPAPHTTPYTQLTLAAMLVDGCRDRL